MRRNLGWVLGIGLMVGVYHVAGAQNLVGHFCFELGPFADLIDLDVRGDIDATGLIHAPYVMTWTGGTSYVLNGGGTAIGREIVAISFVASHGTEFFGGNPVCEVNATLDLAANKGPWMFHCDGPNGPFVNAGELVPVDCAISVIPTHGMPLAGDMMQ